MINGVSYECGIWDVVVFYCNVVVVLDNIDDLIVEIDFD